MVRVRLHGVAWSVSMELEGIDRIPSNSMETEPSENLIDPKT